SVWFQPSGVSSSERSGTNGPSAIDPEDSTAVAGTRPALTRARAATQSAIPSISHRAQEEYWVPPAAACQAWTYSWAMSSDTRHEGVSGQPSGLVKTRIVRSSVRAEPTGPALVARTSMQTSEGVGPAMLSPR